MAPDDAWIDEAREYIHKQKDWFRVDELLHAMAVEHHAAYRSRVLRPRDPYRDGDNSRLAYEAGEERVWLIENWYDPEPTALGLAWWAGPKRAGRIYVRRKAESRFLAFDVIVINGVSHESILLMDPKTFQALPVTRTQKDGCVSFCVNLEGMDAEQELVVWAPDCPAPIMTTLDHDGLTRQSFAAVNWRLSNTLEAGVLSEELRPESAAVPSQHLPPTLPDIARPYGERWPPVCRPSNREAADGRAASALHRTA